jgi:hypothetical protein
LLFFAVLIGDFAAAVEAASPSQGIAKLSLGQAPLGAPTEFWFL